MEGSCSNRGRQPGDLWQQAKHERERGSVPKLILTLPLLFAGFLMFIRRQKCLERPFPDSINSHRWSASNNKQCLFGLSCTGLTKQVFLSLGLPPPAPPVAPPWTSSLPSRLASCSLQELASTDDGYKLSCCDASLIFERHAFSRACLQRSACLVMKDVGESPNSWFQCSGTDEASCHFFFCTSCARLHAK